MQYIEMEYDNVPDEVSSEMDIFFNDCFDRVPPMCFPNAAGLFHENFMGPKTH